MTMPSFHKILATSALCLAALGLCSCISTSHRVVKAWGQSADEVYWVNELGGTTDCLYRIGNELYVQAYRSSGDVTMGGISPWGNYLMLDWATPKYDVTPHTDKAEKVWLRLVNENWNDVRREFRYGDRNLLSENVSLRVTCKDTLTELPPHAIRVEVPRKRKVELFVVDGLKAGMNVEYSSDSKEERPSTYISADAHALYAYPLSAIMFVGVDVPFTLISPVWVVPATVIALSQYGR